MADFYGGFGRTKTALEDSDLQEEEVWAAIIKANEISTSTSNSNSNSNSKTRKKFSPAGSSSSAITPQAIPRSNTNQDSTTGWVTQHSSAPVDIPDWSKIMEANKKIWDSCEYSNHDGDDDYTRIERHHFKLDDGGGGGDDDDDDKMVPPHEYLAKKLASTQIASYSMCEGVGRTLKGRDLSKLRNAILTKTGFLE